MSEKTLGLVVLVIGVLLFLVSAFADALGIGGSPGIGWKQILGVIVGVAVAAYGLMKMRSGPRGAAPGSPGN